MRSPDIREPVEQGREQAPEVRAGRSRETTWRFDEKEIRAMRIVGAFRAVDGRDIEPDSAKRLVARGLMERKTVFLRRGRERREVLVLTAKGRELLRSQQADGDAQKYYAGLVKPNELEHDMAIYAAFREQAAVIEEAGGRIGRVVLDYELKGAINREMNREQGPSAEERRRRLARDFDLPMVDDRLALPDVRIEYTDRDGRERHLDVEVITRHYRGAHRAGKTRSGFRLVSAGSVRAGVNDDHQLEFWG